MIILENSKPSFYEEILSSAAIQPSPGCQHDLQDPHNTGPHVTHYRGQKRINLQSALAAQPRVEAPLAMTFGELARAYLVSNYDGADMQLRKWVELFENTCAWDVSPQEITRAGLALIENGYSPSTVNRNISQIGSVYRWAKKRLLTPAGFISPTLSQHRYEEPVRRVNLSDKEVQRLIDGSAGEKDRRFQVLIRLLVETGARFSEVAERVWSDFDFEACSIEVIHTKTGRPRMLFFSQDTLKLILRVWPTRPNKGMPFESEKAQGKVKNYKKPWEKLTNSIGRRDIRIHDLRHYRAKLLLASGVTV